MLVDEKLEVLTLYTAEQFVGQWKVKWLKVGH